MCQLFTGAGALNTGRVTPPRHCRWRGASSNLEQLPVFITVGTLLDLFALSVETRRELELLKVGKT